MPTNNYSKIQEKLITAKNTEGWGSTFKTQIKKQISVQIKLIFILFRSESK